MFYNHPKRYFFVGSLSMAPVSITKSLILDPCLLLSMGKHHLIGGFSLVLATLGPHVCVSSLWHKKHRRFKSPYFDSIPHQVSFQDPPRLRYPTFCNELAMDVLGSAIVFSLVYVYMISECSNHIVRDVPSISCRQIRSNHCNSHHHNPRRVLRRQIDCWGRFMATIMDWPGKSYRCYWLVNKVHRLRVFFHRLSSSRSKDRRICLIYKHAFIWNYNSFVGTGS